MRITIVAVHPAVIIIKYGTGQLEVPASWFPVTPKVDQTWELTLEHLPSEQEKLDQLNSYLARS